MIKKNTLLLFFFSCGLFAQMQTNAPWLIDLPKKSAKSSELTIDEIAKNAEVYFKTIDRKKKGSGLKPFERWRYHWSFYTDENGKIKSSSDLWNAWEAKNQKNELSITEDVSNWSAVGPFQSSNTYSSSSFKSSGQGRVNVVAVDPSNSNIYYVGAPAGGIWKSTDAGINWTPLTDNLPQIGVSGIAIHPTDSNIIYIATGDDDAGDSYAVGVWKSINGGTTWSETGTLSGSPRLMNDIYIDPISPENVVVATSSGIHKSINGGTEWTNTLSLSVGSRQNNIDLKRKPGNPNTFYVVAKDKFYKSTDGGSSFTEKTITGLTSSTRLAMDVTIANDAYIYIVSYLSGSGPNENGFNGVFKSTDSGETFTKTTEVSDIFDSSQSWYDLAITVSDVNPEIVYVGVIDIYKSTNGGNGFSRFTDWTNPDSQSFVHADIHFLRFIDGKFFAGTDGGIYVSANEGVDFTDLTETLSISQFYKISVAVQDASILAGGLQDNGGFAYNNNQWVNYHGGDGMEGNVDPTNKNIHYGFTQYGGRLTRTNNKGTSTSLSLAAPDAETDTNDSGGEWVTPMALNSKGEVYAAYSKLYKLVNNTWQEASSFSFTEDADHLEINPKDDNNIFVAEGSDLYVTNDGGLNFTQISFSGGNINGIEVSPKDSNIIWIVTNSGVYKSSNIKSGSPSFTIVGTSVPSEGKFVVKFHERSGKNTIYLGTALGVYFYNDDNTDWQVFDNNLPNVAVRDLEINENESKIFAGTYGRGVFVTDIPRILPAVDINFSEISNLDGTIKCGNSITPSLTIKNEGTSSLSEVVIEYAYDNSSTKETYTWTGTLNPQEVKEISLPEKAFDLGIHELEANVILENDDFEANNTVISSFIINNPISEPLFLNQFDSESETNDLLTETIGTTTSVWTRGAPSGILLKNTASGLFVYGTNLEGNYPEDTTSYLYSNCYDLSLISDPEVKFQMAFDIENEWDYLVFEYSIDTGKTWNILGNANSPSWYSSSAITDSSGGSNLPGKQWTGEGENNHPSGGTNATLREYSHDLSSVGSATNIVFRFKLYSDQYVTEEGVVVDDFRITGSALSTADNDILKDEFLVYPNPSKDVFNLSWNMSGTADVSVYNYLGKVVLTTKSVNKNTYKVDLSTQSKGLYFIKINVDGKQTVRKVILE
jgi:hypothetical protein